MQSESARFPSSSISIELVSSSSSISDPHSMVMAMETDSSESSNSLISTSESESTIMDSPVGTARSSVSWRLHSELSYKEIKRKKEKH